MPHPFANKCLNARKHFEKVFLSVLELRRQKPDENYDDFLQVLIESKYDDQTFFFFYLLLTRVFFQGTRMVPLWRLTKSPVS